MRLHIHYLIHDCREETCKTSCKKGELFGVENGLKIGVDSVSSTHYKKRLKTKAHSFRFFLRIYKETLTTLLVMVFSCITEKCTCAHVGQTATGEPPEDGEMNEMALPSRHRARNSSSGGLRPSMFLLCHGDSQQYWIITSERERNILFLWNLFWLEWGSNPRSPTFQADRYVHHVNYQTRYDKCS